MSFAALPALNISYRARNSPEWRYIAAGDGGLFTQAWRNKVKMALAI
jgi:hypothetical protein